MFWFKICLVVYLVSFVVLVTLKRFQEGEFLVRDLLNCLVHAPIALPSVLWSFIDNWLDMKFWYNKKIF